MKSIVNCCLARVGNGGTTRSVAAIRFRPFFLTASLGLGLEAPVDRAPNFPRRSAQDYVHTRRSEYRLHQGPPLRNG